MRIGRDPDSVFFAHDKHLCTIPFPPVCCMNYAILTPGCTLELADAVSTITIQDVLI